MKNCEGCKHYEVHSSKYPCNDCFHFFEGKPDWEPSEEIAAIIEEIAAIIEAAERKAFQAAFKWFGVNEECVDHKEIIEDAFKLWKEESK